MRLTPVINGLAPTKKLTRSTPVINGLDFTKKLMSSE